MTAYIQQYNISTRALPNKKNETKTVLIAFNSQRPTRDFNQKKQFATTTKESFLQKPTTNPVIFSRGPSDHQANKMAVKPQQIWDYSYVDVVPSHPEYDEVMPESYQFDSFEGYQEYEEDRAYLNI